MNEFVGLKVTFPYKGFVTIIARKWAITNVGFLMCLKNFSEGKGFETLMTDKRPEITMPGYLVRLQGA